LLIFCLWENDEMTVSSENPTIELGLWSRAVNIFTHPTRTFVSILDQPKVLGALLITLVFTFVGTLVTFDILYDAQIDAIYEVDSMAPEEQEKTAVTMAESTMSGMFTMCACATRLNVCRKLIARSLFPIVAAARK